MVTVSIPQQPRQRSLARNSGRTLPSAIVILGEHITNVEECLVLQDQGLRPHRQTLWADGCPELVCARTIHS